MDEEHGIYRGEVSTIMGTMADIVTDTREILAILRRARGQAEPA